VPRTRGLTARVRARIIRSRLPRSSGSRLIASLRRRSALRPPAAVVVPRAEHPISRADISSNALKVLYRLKDAGYQGFLVGGAVPTCCSACTRRTSTSRPTRTPSRCASCSATAG